MVASPRSSRRAGRGGSAVVAVVVTFAACGFRTPLYDANVDQSNPVDLRKLGGDVVEVAPRRLDPPEVPPLGGLRVAAGACHTCAVVGDGRVLCWGCNHGGQLGSAGSDGRPLPAAVDFPDFRATDISANWLDTCAIRDPSGELDCWGEYDAPPSLVSLSSGQYSQVKYAGLDAPVIAVDNGDELSCALTASGRVFCWGVNFKVLDSRGTLQPDFGEPVELTELSPDTVAIVVGGYHACALSAAGEVRCWGSNEFGQCGGAPAAGRMVAPPVPLPPVAAITAGWDHSCALTVAGAIKCWGWNGFGQLGNGTTDETATPIDVPGLPANVIRLVGAAESHRTCAVTADGLVECWGDDYPKIRPGWKPADGPVEVRGLDMPIETLAIGWSHMCAVTLDHRLLCWGENDSGQLGTGSYVGTDLPTLVPGF